ncbi:Ig-like domain-containing protein [Massilia alkalitolerans]|uniref:Ig-like domain-containing protein n=1 Tax=Massilia alkalitolerans TaxID=286638 RepID=UPI0028A7664F|nr:Ig-like domain-containing protein [Massilia alkalitolerans]
MPTTTIPPSVFPIDTAWTSDGVRLTFAGAISKGSGSIFVTDGAVQTVIDRVTGEPRLRVVGGSFTKELSLDQVSISDSHQLTFSGAGLPAGATLNVYMGTGTLLSGGKPLAAITLPGSAAFTTPAAEPPPPPPPGLGATVSIADGVLKAGAPLEMLVSFSHAVDAVPLAEFSAEHARVEYLARSEDGLSWRFRLVQDDSVDSASNVVRLNLAAVQPRDSLPHSGTVTSAPYAVDTLVDSHVGARILLVHDNGLSADDGITNDPRQLVSGTLVGTIDEGEHLELVINSRTVDPAKIGFSTENGITTWRYDSENERAGDQPAHLFGDGPNTIVARVVGNGHASPAATRTVTVDTVAPGIKSAPAGGVDIDLGADLVIVFSEAVRWFADTDNDDPEYKEDVLTIWIGDDHRSIPFDTGWLSADGLTLRIPAAVHQMMPDTGYTIVLPRTMTDMAGNPFGEYEIDFHTDDGHLPSAERVTVYAADGYYRAGEQIQFYVSFSEQVKVAGDSAPSLILSNGKRAMLDDVYGSEMLFTYTVEAGDDIASLRIADTSQLAGNVADLSGKLLDAAHIDFSDGIYNGSGYGSKIDLVVDTIAPTAPAAATLSAASDSGTLGDNITRDATPALHGKGEAHARISIYKGTTWLGSTTADAAGAWSIASILPLEDGVHALTVVQRDRAGNTSAASSVLTLTIDTAIPVAPAAPVLDAGSDSGTPGDGITSDNSPTLSGSAEAHATVEIYDGGALLGTAVANASGAWSATIGAAAPLADGLHDITVRQVDRAGNRSDASPELALTISASASDTPAAPPAPAAPVLALSSDSGTPGDGITNDNAPPLSGTALAHATVELYAGADLLGTTTAAGDGSWSLTLGAATPLADGVREITVRQVDGSGNRSAPSAPLVLTIDTVAAVAPAEPALSSASDTGNVGDRITSDNAPTLSGVVEAHANVQIYDGATLLATTSADAAGLWSATLGATTPLADGKHGITVKQVDRAGNVSAASMVLELTIDTVGPAALPNAFLASDTGISDSDGITRERWVALRGSGAEPYTEVRIFAGATEYGSGYSDGTGNWTAHVSSPLNEGEHSFKVRQVDGAGNLGAESPPVRVVVDLTGPDSAPPKPLLAASSDTGISNSDGITRDATPTFHGSGAMANSVVALFVDEREVGNTVTDALGNWTITSTVLGDGYHSVGLKPYDVAGNKSGYSESFNLRIDTTPPAKLALPDLDAASDSGSSNSDNITNDTTPTFKGSGAEAGATIVLYAGSREIGRQSADAVGNWTLTVRDADKFSTDGSYLITARQIDQAGNTSAASKAFNLVIDTTGPTVIGFDTSKSAREFKLGFSEQIVFHPSGIFKLVQAAGDLLDFRGNSGNNWYTTDSAAGPDSVLNFRISLTGFYNLHMNNEAVQDLAGNVAVIGSPQWVVDLPGISS